MIHAYTFTVSKGSVVNTCFFSLFQELLADAKKSQHDVKVGINSSVRGM